MPKKGIKYRVTHKKCSKCEGHFPNEDFVPDKDGIPKTTVCRACRNKSLREKAKDKYHSELAVKTRMINKEQLEAFVKKCKPPPSPTLIGCNLVGRGSEDEIMDSISVREEKKIRVCEENLLNIINTVSPIKPNSDDKFRKLLCRKK